MNKSSKIYIAGHAGLVGSALYRNLRSLGYNNIVFRTIKELDLRNQAECEKFFAREKPEYVFLAAAKVGGILANSTYTAEFIYDNIMISANIINSSYAHGVKKLLNLGSSCIYPRLAPQPIKESCLLTGPLEPTNEPYAIAKIAAIKLCRYYNKQYGTNFASVMPANLYGPGDNFNLETAHVLPALIRKFHLARLLQKSDYHSIKNDLRRYRLGYGLDETYNKTLDKKTMDKILKKIGIEKNKVKVWGRGDIYREFLYVDDLARACIFIMNHKDAKAIGELINIGTGKDVLIKDAVKIIEEIAGFKGEVIFDRKMPSGMPRKRLDISKIKGLGWEPEVKLKDGLKKYYAWYVNTKKFNNKIGVYK